jgi:signal transduction histidine kinase
VKALRLQPTTTPDLPQAIAAMGHEHASDHSTRFNLSVEGSPRSLDPIVREEVLRIAHEALTNAFRHAFAAKIEAEIIFDRAELSLRIRDDGRGIDGSILKSGRADHWGLPGMRERAKKIRANLEVWSRPGAGTEVAVTVPAQIAYARKASRWTWRSATQRVEH